MGLSSTLTYTLELILCSTICENVGYFQTEERKTLFLYVYSITHVNIFISNTCIYFHFYEIYNAYYFIIVYYDRIAPYKGVVNKSIRLMYMYFPLLQMLTINLEESDCFAAWISVTDVPGLEPKVVDGKGVY